MKTSEFNAPQLPPFNDSPKSSAPSTPTDEIPRLGHRRTDSVTIEGEDYFLSLAKFASGDSKSIPGTPRSIAARNISFSPRIQFHDTWPSGEYDRRGEIATCNRLTPMLAQQIKEELNTFKMVFRHLLKWRVTANTLKGNGSTRTIQGLHTLLLIQADLHQVSPMKSQILPTRFKRLRCHFRHVISSSRTSYLRGILSNSSGMRALCTFKRVVFS